MSVILYEDEKFGRIAKSLDIYRGNFQGDIDGRRFACIFGYPNGWDNWGGMKPYLDQFVRDLREANIQAWNNRYTEREHMGQIDLEEGEAYKNRFELLKSLESVRYNIVEAEDGVLYDRLSHVIEAIMSDIIEEMPEYQKADTW